MGDNAEERRQILRNFLRKSASSARDKNLFLAESAEERRQILRNFLRKSAHLPAFGVVQRENFSHFIMSNLYKHSVLQLINFVF